MDPSICLRACYLGLMPGQTKTEVLAILQSLRVNNPEINDEKDEIEGTTSIDWDWPQQVDLRMQPYLYSSHGTVAFLNDYSIWISAAPRELVTASLLIKQFGEPSYVAAGGAGDDWRFNLIYLHKDTILLFTIFTVPQSRSSLLSANTPVQRITIETVETYFAWACWEYGEIK
ncbi:MAG: hypothetical protein KJ063_25380, partial [Anaerolineae bacterium]|nr:hypothetical protein [Anaerolineae bacterium]